MQLSTNEEPKSSSQDVKVNLEPSEVPLHGVKLKHLLGLKVDKDMYELNSDLKKITVSLPAEEDQSYAAYLAKNHPSEYKRLLMSSFPMLGLEDGILPWRH